MAGAEPGHASGAGGGYWRILAPKRNVHLRLDLTAAVPGTYTGPASRTYLHDTPEQKQWNDPLVVEITRD